MGHQANLSRIRVAGQNWVWTTFMGLPAKGPYQSFPDPVPLRDHHGIPILGYGLHLWGMGRCAVVYRLRQVFDFVVHIVHSRMQ